MIRSTLIWLAGLTTLLLTGCTSEPAKAVEKSPGTTQKIDKLTRMDLAVEQEFEMTVDPALGRVPRERLLAAKIELQNETNGQQRSAIPGISWEERGPNNVSGRTRDILIDAADPSGNTIYAGSVGGGLWKCENALSNNPSWTTVNDFFENLAVCAIAQDPNNSDIIYFGTGEGFYNGDAIAGIGLWKSIDGGASWNYLNSTDGPTFYYTQKLVVNATGTLFAATRNGGVQASTDGGQTWNKILGSGEGASSDRAADLELATNGDLYATLGLFDSDGIYKSTNNGENWTRLTNGLPNNGYERIEVAIAPSNASVVYALFQDSDSRECQGIYVSTNGGDSWIEKDSPPALGMSNFARSQAWYDLIAAVDPNDPDRIFIGGVDLLASKDGGDSWEQVSQWYGGAGMQYVHADQHSIRFLPGNSDVAYFGNDGGVFLTTNASNDIPDIDFISTGYNVTQFYACAIHPEENVDYFLAGAQDNGTQQFSTPGINNTFQVTGGDGALCHIDQDDPQVQITTYVYSNYRVSTDGGVSFSNRDFSNEGRFVNPFVYDDPANKIYGAYTNGDYLRWNDPATAGSDYDIVSVSNFGNNRVSHVMNSPNVDNRIYFGLGNGNLVRVDDADSGTTKTGTLLYNGNGYLSSVAIEEGNEDHILITYSNYGVISVFETTDGGDSWTDIEGNLPDVPIRWIIFSPVNNDAALVATEVGVWSTSNLDGTSTEWAPSNDGLANVRVSMLKSRSSDNLVIAATHGRGLFSTAQFSGLFVGFSTTQTSLNEFTDTGADGDCNLNFQDLDIPVSVNRLPSVETEDFTVYFNVVDTSSAIVGEDYILLTDSLQFSSTDVEKTKYARVRILDDAIEEAPVENIIIELSVNTDAETTNTLYAIEITDNDPVPPGGAIDLSAQIGTDDLTLQDLTPFRGYWEDAKAQYLYRASELTEMGLQPGPISELALDVSNLGSTIDYNGFIISLKGSDIEEFTDNSLEAEVAEVYSATFDPVLGWNTFVFDTPFEWNGTDNLIVQICFNNTQWTDDDEVNSSNTDFVSSAIRYLDGAEGCALTTYSLSTSRRPNILLRQLRQFNISDQLDRKTGYVSENEVAHYYDGNGAIILSVRNLAGGDLGCLDVQIDQYGTGQVQPAWLSGSMHTEKTFLVTSDNNAPYEITLYLSQEELAAWDDPSQLSILKTPDAITAQMGDDFQVLEPSFVTVTPIGTEGDFTYTATFQSFSGFAITNSPPVSPLPLEILSLKAEHNDGVNEVAWQTTNEVAVNYLELQRSLDGTNFTPINREVARNNAPARNDYQYLDRDLRIGNADYYYRLKVVDLDETHTYSEIVNVNVATGLSKSQVFPNPFSDRLNVNPPTGQKIEKIIVNDMVGRTIRTEIWNNSSLDLSKLTSGVYWIKLVYGNGQSELHRVVKSK